MGKPTLTLKVFLAILLNDLWNSLAQLLMKKGVAVTNIHFLDFQSLLDFVTRNLASPLLWMGILVYASNFFIWMIILSKVDLSVAMPMGSIGYILTPFMAILFLGEAVTPLRWFAIVLIMAGIYVISQSEPTTAEGPPPT
jgi:drug/metabolite transporter (DMT)-like permease